MTIVTSIFGYFSSFLPGPRLVDGSDLQNLTGLLFSSMGPVTALAGGGAQSAPLLASAITVIGTVVTAGDSLVLPPALPGLRKLVDNEAGLASTIFASLLNPATGQGDQITPSGTAVPANSISLPAGHVCEFVCTQPGIWKQFLSA